MTTELLNAPKSCVAEYQPFYAQLSELEQINLKLVFDYESKKGNKEARSHVNTLRLTKGALERTRKEAKAESLRIGRAIDSEAAEIEKRIEAMIIVHQSKIDEIEQREVNRINAIKEKLSALGEIHQGQTAADYRLHIAALEMVTINETWQEFIAEAAQKKDASIAKYRQLLLEREKYDSEQAELDRLRAEAVARAQKDRDEAIAKAAAEKAIIDAELKAKQEADKARQLIEEAERKAKQDRDAAERRELELKLQAEHAERRRIEAEQKAEQDKKDALAKAEIEKNLAIKAEQERIFAKEKAEESARAEREANKAHREKINNESLEAFISFGVKEDCAKDCIKLIALAKIPHIQIYY
tara:strand:- start:9028 stop:10098 length:1071 start_codon:yes stop_codon:yes gene_type:complete